MLKILPACRSGAPSQLQAQNGCMQSDSFPGAFFNVLHEATVIQTGRGLTMSQTISATNNDHVGHNHIF